MSARECPCCFEGRNPGGACKFCGGTGKVHPSVEGEVVREEFARQYPGTDFSINLAGIGWLRVPGPGRYKVIVQKVGE